MVSTKKLNFNLLQQLAKSIGLEVIGVSKANKKASDAKRLKLWQEKGYAAEMNYMQRDPELQSDPLRLLPEAKTVISIAISYDRSPRPELLKGYGKVARYAWGRDYHLVLPPKLEQLIKLLNKELGNFKYRVFSDAVPFLERAFAAESGIGFIGKNTLLIKPKIGSFTLLSEIISELEITDYIPNLFSNSCGNCTRCLEACPTKAFESEYVLNANKCISYLTIEKKGALQVHERKMLGEWIFGCDICQEVCPYNHGSLKSSQAPDLEDFLGINGSGANLSIKEILEIKDQAQFKIKFKNSPILRSKRQGMIRNAICVAVNTNFTEVTEKLKDLLENDENSLVRQFALWGYIELSRLEGNLTSSQLLLLNNATKDPDISVASEAKSLLNS